MNKQDFFIQAINSLVPKRTNWRLDESILTWGDNGNYTPPTNEQIQAKADELEAAYVDAQYQRNRVSSYPSITEQLDMIYHDIKSGNLNSGGWIQSIELIKRQYPKPE